MKTKFYLAHSLDKKALKEKLYQFDFLKLQYPKLKLVYLFNEEDLLDDSINETVQSTIDFISKFGIKTKDFCISFEHQVGEKINNNETLKKLISLENKHKDVVFGIEDDDTTWSSKKILNANSQLDEIVNEIKSKNLSEIETLLYAYLFVTSKKYNDPLFVKNRTLSRSVYGVLNSNKIVCVGYCELLREIIARLKLKNVKLFLNNVSTVQKGRSGYHRNLVVFIDDKKYKTSGYYILDPTNDSKTNQKENYKANYFLLAFSEQENLKDYKYKYLKKDKISFNICKEKTYIYDDVKVFNRLEGSKFISFSQNRAQINKEFYDFLRKDKKYAPLVEQITKIKGENSEELKKTVNYFYDFFKKNNPPIPLPTMYLCFSNILKEKGYSFEEMKNKMREILKLNFEMNKSHFEKENNSTFSYKILKDYKKINNEDNLKN